MSDEDLIARYYGCDDAAFAELYRRNFCQVYAFLRRTLKDHHVAEDLAEEVFVRVVQGKHRGRSLYDPNRGTAFRTWLFAIARHVLLDYLRRTRVRSGHLSPDSEAEPEGSLIDPVTDPAPPVELIAMVRECLAKMPAEYREVIELVYMQGFILRETAAILDIPQGTVASRVSRGREWFAIASANLICDPDGLRPDFALDGSSAHVFGRQAMTRDIENPADDARLVELLRAADPLDLTNAPAQHSQRTPHCPSLPRSARPFATGGRRTRPAMLRHVTTVRMSGRCSSARARMTHALAGPIRR